MWGGAWDRYEKHEKLDGKKGPERVQGIDMGWKYR